MKRRGFHDYFRFNRIILQICGIMPLETWGIFANVSAISIGLVSTGFLVFPSLYSVILHWERIAIEERANIFSEVEEILIGAVKVSILLPKRQRMLGLVHHCERLWMSVENQDDFKAVQTHANRGLYLTYGFAWNVVVAVGTILAAPAFTEFVFDANGTMLVSKRLPYSVGIDHENILTFNIWYALQIPAGIISTIPIVGIDTGVAALALNACAHMKLTQSWLRRIKDNQGFTEKNWSQGGRVGKAKSWQNDTTTSEIMKCILHHQDVLHFRDELEDVFSLVLLVQTVLCMSVICCYGFNLVMQDRDHVKYGVHLVGSTLQLLILCWPVDNLISESVAVSDAAYSIPWYNWPKKDRRLVEFMMARAQMPASLTAGKFSVISLATFSSILSTAFSFFTVLRTVL